MRSAAHIGWTRAAGLSRREHSTGAWQRRFVLGMPTSIRRFLDDEDVTCQFAAHHHRCSCPLSRDDLDPTRQLPLTRTLLWIKVLDHTIIGDGRPVSLREIGDRYASGCLLRPRSF